jgi:hypothetical protein
VGWDGNDDGGQLAWKKGLGVADWDKKDSEVDAAKGDWVWVMRGGMTKAE